MIWLETAAETGVMAAGCVVVMTAGREVVVTTVVTGVDVTSGDVVTAVFVVDVVVMSGVDCGDWGACSRLMSCSRSCLTTA